jgi:hypothetical protein
MTQDFHSPEDSQVIQQVKAVLDNYQRIAADDYGVTNHHQALPIASRPDIAFRPACSQLSEVWLPGGFTAYTFEGEEVYRQAGQHKASSAESRLFLSGAGVCIDGDRAVDVPLVPTDAVLTRAKAGANAPIISMQPSETVVTQTIQADDEPPPVVVANQSSLTGVVLPILALMGVSAILVMVWRNMQKPSMPSKKREKPATQAMQPKPVDDDFELEL